MTPATKPPDLAAATVPAREMARSLTFLPELDPGDTTVSAEDGHRVPRRVFCDRRLTRAGGAPAWPTTTASAAR